MPIVTIPFKGIRYKGEHTPALEYMLNSVVSHPETGVKYIAYAFDVPTQISITDISYWKFYDDGDAQIAAQVVTNANDLTAHKNLNIMYRYDKVTRVFGTTMADGKTWDMFTKTAGTSVMLSWRCPFRNHTDEWGGGYIDILLSVDGGDYMSIGTSGFDGGVMVLGAYAIGSMSGTLLLDLYVVRHATSIQIKFRHRSLDNTLTINGDHDIDTGALGAFWSQITLQEVEHNVL